jgi:serine/threonine-protein kinase
LTSDDDDKPVSPIAQTVDATAAADPLVGRTLGHYRIVGRLGAGGMGVVYRAEDEKLRRAVALKVLPDTSGNEERRQRFLREARSAAAITHPNVAVVYQVDEQDGRIYIAMELVKGENLRTRMDRGRLDRATAKDLAVQIARGLAAAHEEGIVHRDLKPENVMITPAGQVKLLDFGLAKAGAAPASGKTAAAVAKTETAVTSDEGRIMGTPEYMSPEQALGEPLDVRSDVFSLGIVLYEMLSGVRPFGGTTTGALLVAIARDEALPLREKTPEVDEGTETVVMRCLAKAPSDRFQSAGEVVTALSGPGTPARVEPLSPVGEPARRPTSTVETAPTLDLRSVAAGSSARGRWVTVGAALVVAIVASVAALTWRSTLRAPPPAAATVAPGASAPRRLVRIIDLPPPGTDSAEARGDYLDALRDTYDARAWSNERIKGATTAGPDCADCWLEGAMVSGGWSGVIPFERALKLRDRLDERGRAILDALRPGKEGRPEESARAFLDLARRFPEDQELASYALQFLPTDERLAAAQKMVADDPGFAGAELQVANILHRLGRDEEAKEHYRACQDKSPHAGLCILALGDLESRGGRCSVLQDATRRVYVFEHDDFTVVNALLDTTMTTGAPKEQAGVLVDTMLAALKKNFDPSDLAIVEAQARGDVALWYGDFVGADADYDVVRKAHPDMAFPQEVDVAEELADPGRASAIARKEFAIPADFNDPQTPVVEGHLLRLMGQLKVAVPGGLEALVRRRRAECERAGKPLQCWFVYDVVRGSTPDEERAASAFDAGGFSVRGVEVWSNAEYGRMLLLAGRPRDAVSFLTAAAQACRLTNYTWFDSSAAVVHRAELWRGQAQEALGDKVAACDAYARAVGSWADAKRRSVTADEARAHATKLGCGL